MNRETLRKLQFPLLIALALYPVSVLILGYASGGLLSWRWLMPLLVLFLSCAAMPVPGKVRLPFGLCGAALLCLAGAYLGIQGAGWKVWLLNITFSAALLWSLRIAGWKREDELPNFWLIGGILIQLAARVIMIAVENTRGKSLASIEIELTLVFYLFVILAMLSLNRSALNQAAMGRTGASRSMRRKNVLLILAVFVISVLISLLPVFVTAAQWVMGKVGDFLMWFGSLFGGDAVGALPPDETSPGPSDSETMAISPFVLLFGKVIAATIIGFILYQLFLYIKEFVVGLIQRAGRFASDAGEDYVDEVTDIREERDQEQKISRGLFRERRNIDALPPEQQVRYQYRRLLRSHKDWSDASTARENIPREMAKIYERARYSTDAVTDAEAKDFRTGTKKL